MGSSCSSRQSTKDSVSIKSEDSQNEEDEKEPRETKNAGGELVTTAVGADKFKLKDKSALRFIESDFSSCGDEGAGVGTPLSSTFSGTCAPDGTAKGRPTDKPELKAEEDLPDLSSLKEDTRLLLEGRDAKDPPNRGNKVFVLIWGQLDGSEKLSAELTNVLWREISREFDSEGLEVVLANPFESVPLYRSPQSPSQIVAEYLKGGSECCLTLVYLLPGSNPSELYEVPATLPAEDFSKLCEAVGEAKDKELLRKWYREDSFTAPTRKLESPHSVFEGLKSSNGDEFEKAKESWSSEYKNIVSVFLKSKTQDGAGFGLTSLLDKGLQLVKDLPSGTPMKVVLVKNRSTDVDEDQIITNLKTKKESVEIFTPKISSSAEEGSDGWRKDFAAELKSSILESVQSSLKGRKNKNSNPLEEGIKTKLLNEISAHQNFSRSILRDKYVGLDNYINHIQTYIKSAVGKPLLISGEEGTGKSVLVAAASNKCQSWCPEAIILTRYVGLTENSTTVDGILHYLIDQITVTHGGSFSHDITDTRATLHKLWKRARSHRPLIAFIDGVDHFSDSDEEILDFLETVSVLPENVKVIVTVRDGTSFRKEFAERIKGDDCILQIQNSNQDYEKMMKEFLLRNDRHLSDSLWKRIDFSPQTPSAPLLLLVLSHLVVAGIEPNSDICGQNMSEEFFNSFFKILQGIFSKGFLEMVLGCLALSRSGLLESEILSMMTSSSLNVTSENPFIDWLYLRRLLGPLLRLRREGNLALFSFRPSVRDATLKFVSETEQGLDRCHQIFFKVIDKYEVNENLETISLENKRLRHLRALQESFLIEDKSKAEIIFNIKWLFQMMETFGPFMVLEKINLALKNNPEDSETSILRSVLQLSSHSLVYDSSQFFSQVYGRLKWRLAKEGNCPRLSGLLTRASESPLPCLLPLSSCLAKARQDSSLHSDKKVHVNAIFRIPKNPEFVIAISTSKSQLTVWNIVAMEVVRTLSGINQPRNLEMIDDYKCLLLCGRELRIYDLNAGTFLMKLREVMNQKMPFFGLYDSDHVVALSRNRMYVNMMNLSEGNCVTTFKVGEDRFLNSLLVSQNGKICVCGDDSQKPSALLVWDLELRKLMYDLRIPHHEFATRLAAITTEGHYVCCVCKEVNEPAPNFIVVYDLQSGTLFKRWKPDVNTLSITISTAGTCVIVGLEDSSIMAFDLITGNLRWTVYGHCSPPDTFRLDQRGLVLLSYDSQGKDRSLRVWDVHTGSTFATLTPDLKISACEITSDGKAVVLAFEGQNSIYTFLLLHREGPKYVIETSLAYGDDEFKGKTVDFSQT